MTLWNRNNTVSIKRKGSDLIGSINVWLVDCFIGAKAHDSCCSPDDYSTPTQSLTNWGRLTHIFVSKLTIIGSDIGLSPGRRQAIIWTNAGVLLIRPLGTKFNEMLVEILIFSFMKMRLKVSSAKCRPFCLGHNELNRHWKFLRTLCVFGYWIGTSHIHLSTS